MGSTILTNAIATHVSTNAPTSNYNHLTRLGVCTTSPEAIAYIFFSRPFPLGATILSAKIHFYTQTMGSGTHTFTFQRLNQTFSASKVTYNTRPTSLISGTKGVTKTGSQPDFEPWELDVTDWMQTISSGGKWYGWRIINNEATIRHIYSENYSLSAFRPRLEVTWSDAPDTPGGLSPAGGRAVGLAKPVLKAVYRDVSGSTQLAALQVQINATDVWTSPSFDSGTVLTSVPELDLATTAYAGLADGVTTFWRIRLQDAAGVWSAWSTAASFKRDDKGVLTVNNPPSGANFTGTRTATSSVSENWAAVSVLLRNAGGTALTIRQQQDAGFVGGSQSFTLSSPVALGDTIALIHMRDWHNLADNLTPTGTAVGGAWTLQHSLDGGTNDFHIKVWTGVVTNATGTVIANSAQTTEQFAAMFALAGTCTVEPGSASTDSDINGTALIAPSASGTTPSELLLCAWGVLAVATVTTPGGMTAYTQRQVNATATFRAASEAVTLALPTVEDATPPIAWGFTGETQAAYQIQINHIVNGVIVPDWDTGKITSTATSITVPAGAVNEPTNTTYTVTVRIWDTKQREATPGDPTYVEVVRNFTFVPGATTGTTSLTAVPDASRPKVVLTWTAATFPDRFNILRNGKVIAAALDPTDTFVSGNTHTYTDQSPSPGRTLTYEVQRVVNNVASASNDTEPATVNTKGIWLREPVSGLELFIAGNDDTEFTLGKQSVALKSIAQNANTVLINQSLGGLEVPISGQLISIYGKTAQEWRDQYIQMRNLRVKRFWLTVGDYTWQVVCDFENYGRRGIPENVFKVGFMAYQQDSLLSILLGS